MLIQQVEASLAEDDDIAQRLFAMTLGMPLAVGFLLDAGAWSLRQIANEPLAALHASVQHEALRPASERLLRSLAGEEDGDTPDPDRDDILTLTIMATETQAERSQLLEDLRQGDNTEKRLAALAKRWSLFVQYQVHSTARHVLRRHWRRSPPKGLDRVIQRLQQTLEGAEAEWPKGAEDGWGPEYDEDPWLLEHLNRQTWREGERALAALAPALACALVNGHGQEHKALISLGSELYTRGPRGRKGVEALEATRRLLAAGALPTWGSDALLDWLASELARDHNGAWSLEAQRGLWVLQGFLLVEQERSAEAFPLLERAVDAGPLEALPRRKEVAERLHRCGYDTHDGDPGEAARIYRRVLELDAGLAKTWNNLGNLLAGQKRHEEADHAYHKAIELNPAFAAPWINHGLLFRRTGHHDRARDVWQQALQSCQGEFLVLLEFCLFEHHAQAGERPQAKAHLDRAIALADQQSAPGAQETGLRLLLAIAAGEAEPTAILQRAAQFGDPAQQPPDLVLGRLAWALWTGDEAATEALRAQYTRLHIDPIDLQDHRDQVAALRAWLGELGAIFEPISQPIRDRLAALDPS